MAKIQRRKPLGKTPMILKQKSYKLYNTKTNGVVIIQLYEIETNTHKYVEAGIT